MRVRVERRRRGRRTPEISYVEAAAPRQRSGGPPAGRRSSELGSSRAVDEGAASTLRLPWRMNGGGRGSA